MTGLHEAVELWIEAQQQSPSPVSPPSVLMEPFIPLD